VSAAGLDISALGPGEQNTLPASALRVLLNYRTSHLLIEIVGGGDDLVFVTEWATSMT